MSGEKIINKRHHMRDIDFKLNILNGESTASCKITAGNILNVPNGIKFSLSDHTSVLCSMLGPYEERRKRIKPTFAVYPNRLRLSIFIRPNCGSIANKYRNYEFVINKILQTIITTNTMPQCGLSFVIQIFNDSGSLLAHSINSSIVACIIGGISIEFIPIAVSIGITKCRAPSDIKSQFIVDPSNEDLARCISTITVVCDPTKGIKYFI